MYTLRCTKRLLRRLPHDVTASLPLPTTVLGDWYANVLYIRHAQLILCTNERSLLSVIVPARDPARLPIRLREAVTCLLRRLRVPAHLVVHEAQAMSELAVGRTVNRSVLGSMNDIGRHCRWHAEDHGALDLRQLELYLAEMPMLTIEPAFPRLKAAALLGAT